MVLRFVEEQKCVAYLDFVLWEGTMDCARRSSFKSSHGLGQSLTPPERSEVVSEMLLRKKCCGCCSRCSMKLEFFIEEVEMLSVELVPDWVLP